LGEKKSVGGQGRIVATNFSNSSLGKEEIAKGGSKVGVGTGGDQSGGFGKRATTQLKQEGSWSRLGE